MPRGAGGSCVSLSSLVSLYILNYPRINLTHSQVLRHWTTMSCATLLSRKARW